MREDEIRWRQKIVLFSPLIFEKPQWDLKMGIYREGVITEKRGSKKGRDSTLRADVISANVVSLFLCLNTNGSKESLGLPTLLFPVRLGYDFFVLHILIYISLQEERDLNYRGPMIP